MDIEYFFYVDDSTFQHLRPATSDERKWYHSLAQELGPYQKNIDRFQRVEDRFSALAEILEAPKKNAAKLERNAKDAVANFLYSFNECLDHWRTYIVRAYGEGSNYFSAYQKLTTLAFDTYDEYKITYALRNFQHVDDVFDGISVRLGMPAQIYAHRQRLLDNSRFTAPQRAAFTKLEECFDLFPIFKTAKEQLEQIEKKLMFYTVTPEQENKAIDALKFKEELCGPHGVLLLGKLLDPNGNELEATDSTIIKLAQEQSEASANMLALIGGGVAGISLLVGGIGIMNIMLVSVTERTREIGIRMAIGARKRDIIGQFLVEAAVVSCFGGLIGIVLGCFLSAILGNVLLAQQMQGGFMPTVEQFTVLPSFGLAVGAFLFSALLGIIFGLYPANKASNLQPVDALRTQ